jgi:phosphonatase-like hydrolase
MYSEPPRLVVFDMAGTTLKDDGGIVNQALQAALAEAENPVSADAVNAVMGLPKPVAIAALLSLSESDGRTVAIYQSFLERMMRFYAEDPAVAEVPGTSMTFLQLREAGIRIALDTGFSHALAETIVLRLGWRTLIDDFIGSDDVKRGRPFPDMIDTLRQRLNIDDPKTVAKLGDTPSDLQQGTAAGCGWVIGVTGGSHTAGELRPHPHTHLIPTVAALPALLGIHASP